VNAARIRYVARGPRRGIPIAQEDLTPLCDPRVVVPHLARFDLVPSPVWGDDSLYLKLPEFVCYVPRAPDVAMGLVPAQEGEILGVEQVIELGILGPSRIGENEG
jgi:hypothetical protein